MSPALSSSSSGKPPRSVATTMKPAPYTSARGYPGYALNSLDVPADNLQTFAKIADDTVR